MSPLEQGPVRARVGAKHLRLRFLEPLGARTIVLAPIGESAQQVVPVLVKTAPSVRHGFKTPFRENLRPERTVVQKNNIRIGLEFLPNHSPNG